MAIDFSSVGPTCQKIEDLIEYARPILNRWPPFYRYTIGEQIYSELIYLLRLATKARLKYYNKTTLQELDTEKEILKALMRQANKTVFVDKKGDLPHARGDEPPFTGACSRRAASAPRTWG